MLSFISFWRAAAIVLNDLGSSAYYVGGIAEQAVGRSAAWFVLAGLLVVTRSPVRIVARFLGWAILIACGAVAVDWWGSGLPQVSAAGRGGSIGAYLRFGLEDALDPLIALAAYWTTLLVGLLLVALEVGGVGKLGGHKSVGIRGTVRALRLKFLGNVVSRKRHGYHTRAPKKQDRPSARRCRGAPGHHRGVIRHLQTY